MTGAWPSVRLDSVCERITVGWVGPMAEEYVSEGVLFLRSQNIRPFGLDMASAKFVTPAFHEKIKKSRLSPGDVAIVRTGYPGTAAVIPKTLAEANCADLVVVTPGPDLDATFLAATLNSAWGVGAVTGRLVGAAQQHFNVSAAKAMEIPLPPVTVQREIARVLNSYAEAIENNTRRIDPRADPDA